MENNKLEYSRIFFIMIIITIFAMFKVYLANETYYTSRDIQKISAKIGALKEEKNILELKIEKLKYKNTITDPLFAYKQDETINANSEVEPLKRSTKPIKTKITIVPKVKKRDTKELFKTINTEDIY